MTQNRAVIERTAEEINKEKTQTNINTVLPLNYKKHYHRVYRVASKYISRVFLRYYM